MCIVVHQRRARGQPARLRRVPVQDRPNDDGCLFPRRRAHDAARDSISFQTLVPRCVHGLPSRYAAYERRPGLPQPCSTLAALASVQPCAAVRTKTQGRPRTLCVARPLDPDLAHDPGPSQHAHGSPLSPLPLLFPSPLFVPAPAHSRRQARCDTRRSHRQPTQIPEPYPRAAREPARRNWCRVQRLCPAGLAVMDTQVMPVWIATHATVSRALTDLRHSSQGSRAVMTGWGLQMALATVGQHTAHAHTNPMW